MATGWKVLAWAAIIQSTSLPCYKLASILTIRHVAMLLVSINKILHVSHEQILQYFLSHDPLQLMNRLVDQGIGTVPRADCTSNIIFCMKARILLYNLARCKKHVYQSVSHILMGVINTEDKLSGTSGNIKHDKWLLRHACVWHSVTLCWIYLYD